MDNINITTRSLSSIIQNIVNQTVQKKIPQFGNGTPMGAIGFVSKQDINQVGYFTWGIDTWGIGVIGPNSYDELLE